MREAMQSVPMCHDALALHIVQNFADLLGRKLVMIQERNKLRNGALKVNIIFPERIVGVDEQGLRQQAFSS
jgi:hypothetical protein